MLNINRKRITALFSVAILLSLAACSSGPQVRSDSVSNTNFSGYKTFGFVEQLATDKAGYTTIVTQNFKSAISNEMNRAGYQFSASNPDLLVNFNSNIENRTEVRSTPSASFSYGYYNYRRGIYAGFPRYTTDVDTVNYKVGTVNIDIVDANKKQLIWEGVAEGTLKKSDLHHPKQAVNKVVNLIMQQYPTYPQSVQ
ncbi:DUF4136 domain-containing protein [Rheinheimera salexigens]|uniref:DUF4136 domain-containing protein n=1 Tax=Rheinheimera salexigens TaxID=1628148 RepID=A0A1E7Q451_9GAMM|nr:DUF4136 domain-containing protein [Rheinheimera salexigens]OEY68955.1 hypothetical protein BI198_04770 [Rheinheimera salexigens]